MLKLIPAKFSFQIAKICKRKINSTRPKVYYPNIALYSFNNAATNTDSPTCQIGVAVASTALLTIAIMAGLSVVIHFIVYCCVYKPKAKSQEPKDITQSGEVVETVMIYEPV